MYFAYILASKKNGTLYIGSTSNLIDRIKRHKRNYLEGFTKKYNVHTLVFYETYNTKAESLKREKQLKKWNRTWKIELIEKNNPDWKDLYDNL